VIFSILNTKIVQQCFGNNLTASDHGFTKIYHVASAYLYIYILIKLIIIIILILFSHENKVAMYSDNKIVSIYS